MEPTSHSRNPLKREARFLALMLILSFFAGVAYATIIVPNVSLNHIIKGGFIGICIATGCAASDLALRTQLNRLPFAALVFTKTIVYAAVGIMVLIASRAIFLPGQSSDLLTDRRAFALTALTTLAISLVANLFKSLRVILGKHAFAWLLMGRYRHPVE
jgi:hypothetical protein